jgi:hypothetical protein
VLCIRNVDKEVDCLLTRLCVSCTLLGSLFYSLLSFETRENSNASGAAR